MKKKKLIVCVLVFVLVFECMFSFIVGAIWKEDEAVHVKAGIIENSTLIIGTHLIHLSALTNELYEIAQNSAIDAGQDNIYYKSELANGAWFDITTASSLQDITTSGTPVTDIVINALLFTHHTKSDGVTYDLRSNQPVNIFDVKSPYDLKSLDELFPLKTQFDLMNESPSDSKSSKAKLARVRQILETAVKNDATNKCDENIKAMQSYYDVLNKHKVSTDQLDVVQSIMSAEDASRRVQVFTVLESILNEYSIELQKSPDDFDTALQSAVNDSLSNVSSSLIQQQGKMLSTGTTVMTQVQYEYSEKLIQDASVNNHSACDMDIAGLLSLTHIVNATVTDKKSESLFLEEILLPKSAEKYSSGLRSGQNKEYEAAAQNKSASVVLKQIIEFNTSTLDVYRNELESYISAQVLRLDSSNAKSFVSKLLDNSSNYYEIVKQDDFAQEAKTTVDKHIAFLAQKLKEIEHGGTGNEMDKLTSQKENLKTQYMSALDNNNLTDAKALEEQLASQEIQIRAKQSERTAALSQAQQKLKSLQDELDKTSKGQNTGESEEQLKLQILKIQSQIPSLEAKLSGNSVGELVTSLKKECLDIIGENTPKSSQLKTLENNINSLGEMQELNYQSVFPALKDIHFAMTSQRDLNAIKSFNSIISALDKTILENNSAYIESLQPELSANKIDTIAENFFKGEKSSFINSGESEKGSVSLLSDKQKQAVYLQALQMYCDKTDSSVAKSKLASLAQQQMNLGNPLVFNRINDVSMQYIPATAVSSYTNMRYVWNKNRNQGTLARGGTYYAFTVHSNVVQKGKGKGEVDKLSKPVKLLASTLYIPADYANTTFDIDTVYIKGTNFGVISSDKLKNFAEQMQSVLMQS